MKSVVPAEEQYVLEDLFPNTIYNIRLTARSSNGEGPHTPTIQVKTEEAGKQSRLTRVTVLNRSACLLTISKPSIIII